MTHDRRHVAIGSDAGTVQPERAARASIASIRRAQALIAKGLGVRAAAVRLRGGRVGKTALYEALRPATT